MFGTEFNGVDVLLLAFVVALIVLILVARLKDDADVGSVAVGSEDDNYRLDHELDLTRSVRASYDRLPYASPAARVRRMR